MASTVARHSSTLQKHSSRCKRIWPAVKQPLRYSVIASFTTNTITCNALAPQPSCRCRRCCTRALAFRWGSSDTTTKPLPDNGANKDDAEDLRLDINAHIPPPSPPLPPQQQHISNSSATIGGHHGGRFAADGDDLRVVLGGKSDSNKEAVVEMKREQQFRELQRSVLKAAHGASDWWRELPDKRSVLLGGAGLVVAAYLGSAVLSAVNRVPLLPGLFEAVGFGASCWFWWRFVLFAEGRSELRESLGQMKRQVAERMDGLAEQTLDSHPGRSGSGNGSGSTTTAGRRVVNRMAARRNENQQQQWRREGVVMDSGSCGEEPGEVHGSTGLDEGYVKGLLEELDGRTRNLSSEGGGAAGGARSPSVFAFCISGAYDSVGMELRAPEPGAEEVAAVGGGNPAPGSGTGSGAPPGTGRGTGTGVEGGGGTHHEMADLDPCLGWDTDACAASGHLKLGAPDKSKLDALERAALRQAQDAVGFSRHVDQVLHEPTSHGHASLESVQLEGEYGRAAGSMEREVMEDLVANNPDSMSSSVSKSIRKPAVGEEAGTGP